MSVALDSNHKSAESKSQAITTDLKPERLQTGIGIQEKFDLPPGMYEVQICCPR